jgi:hypothetical protein
LPIGEGDWEKEARQEDEDETTGDVRWLQTEPPCHEQAFKRPTQINPNPNRSGPVLVGKGNSVSDTSWPWIFVAGFLEHGTVLP